MDEDATEREPPEPVTWGADGTPRSPRFDDAYFSSADGRAESVHVFLNGNDLPARWDRAPPARAFHVAELGFGTGLNFLVTLSAWRAAAPGGTLVFTSFERYPVTEAVRQRALARWPDLLALWAPWARRLGARAGWQEHREGDVELRLAVGDASALVSAMSDPADAWFLDGFCPAKNPSLWSASLMRVIAAQTVAGGTFATFTAAGWVRRNLAAAGFTVTRCPGFGRKRHMTRGFRGTAGPDRASCQSRHGPA